MIFTSIVALAINKRITVISQQDVAGNRLCRLKPMAIMDGYRTCSTEAEIRHHGALEAPQEINAGGDRRIPLAVSLIRHT